MNVPSRSFFCQARFVFADLPFDVGAGIVEGVAEALASDLAAEECSCSGDCYLDVSVVMLTAERNRGVTLTREKVVEFGKRLVDELFHLIINVHLSANYGNLHLAFLAFLSVLRRGKDTLRIYSIAYSDAFVKNVQKMFTF